MRLIGYIIVDKKGRQWHQGAMWDDVTEVWREARLLEALYPKSAPFDCIPVYASLMR